MASIGSYEVDQWVGFMPRPMRQMKVLENFPNVDGVSILAAAFTTKPAEIMTAFLVDDNNAAQDLMDSLIAMMEDPISPITVVDQFGVSYDGCVIITCDPIPSDLADGTSRVDVKWVFQVPTYEP